MAWCDNLYGTAEQWQELYDFLQEKKPEYIRYMKQKPEDDGETERICYIPDIQGWLEKNCPFVWVQEELETNFNIQQAICGKAHHEKG